jgi:hypothetical protein
MTDDLAGTVRMTIRQRVVDLFQALDVGHMGMATKRWAELLDTLIEVRLEMSHGMFDAAKALVGGQSSLDERVAALESRLGTNEPSVALRWNGYRMAVPVTWHGHILFMLDNIRLALRENNIQRADALCLALVNNDFKEVKDGGD